MLWLRRLRLYQNKRTLILVSLLFLFTISVGIYLTLTPSTYSVTETLEKNEYSSEYVHYSISSQDSELFKEGERSVSPNRYYIYNHKKVNLNYNPTVNGSDIKDSKYSSDYSIYITAETPTSNEIVYRKNIEPSKTEIVSVSGNKLNIDMAQYQDRIESLRQELPQGSIVHLRIDRITTMPQIDSGGKVTLTNNANIYFSDVRTYVVDVETEPVEKRQTKTIQRPQPSQTLQVYGQYLDTTGLFVIFVGLGILSLLSYLVYVRLYIDKDQEQLRFEYEVNKYSSWITSGKPYQDPTFQDDSDIIQVGSIKGLVDIAVDNTTRVVHTEQSGRFYVYDDQAIYTYTAPGRDNMGFYIGPDEKLPAFDPDTFDGGDQFNPEDIPKGDFEQPDIKEPEDRDDEGDEDDKDSDTDWE